MGYDRSACRGHTLARRLQRVTYVFLFACLVGVVMGLVCLWRAHQLRERTGLPSGSLVYIDTTEWQACQRPFFSNRYRLTGKPDYLLHHQNHIIPVEVKSSTGLAKPYDSHILQLMAYCLLVEDVEKKSPPFGLLHYPDADFRLEYSPHIKTELLHVLAELKADLDSTDVPRSHTNTEKCKGCGYRHVCTQSL